MKDGGTKKRDEVLGLRLKKWYVTFFRKGRKYNVISVVFRSLQ